MSHPQPLSPTRPTAMGSAWLRNTWQELTFLHYRYDPADVQRLLPDGLTVDTFDGDAYVSLIPFQMRDASPRFVPALPFVSSFNETNVRTYVVDSAGNRAIWFFTLEADQLAVVALARLVLGFPYVWSAMSTEIEGTRRTYRTTNRRWPRTPRSQTTVEIEVGGRIDEPDDLDVFLTARWGTVARWPMRRGRLRHHPVDHAAWWLHEATLTRVDHQSLPAAGLPAPTDPPIVRWVRSIDARFAPPTRV